MVLVLHTAPHFCNFFHPCFFVPHLLLVTSSFPNILCAPVCPASFILSPISLEDPYAINYDLSPTVTYFSFVAAFLLWHFFSFSWLYWLVLFIIMFSGFGSLFIFITIAFFSFNSIPNSSQEWVQECTKQNL